MLQYIIVFAIVGIAAIYTVVKLFKQAKNGNCSGCPQDRGTDCACREELLRKNK